MVSGGDNPPVLKKNTLYTQWKREVRIIEGGGFQSHHQIGVNLLEKDQLAGLDSQHLGAAEGSGSGIS